MEFEFEDRMASFPLQDHLKADPRLIKYDRTLGQFTFETGTVD